MNKEYRRLVFPALLVTALLAGFFTGSQALAMSDEDCLGCHNDAEMTTEKNGETIHLFVDEMKWTRSVHAGSGCNSCHEDAEGDGEHPFPLAPVNCANCHDEANTVYMNSVHGQMLAQGNPVAPKCSSCHTKHDILPKTNSESSIFKLNIPATCGSCHTEDSPMPKNAGIEDGEPSQGIVMLIHEEGLFKKGLTVTAECNDCHSAHNVQPPSHPDSLINRKNVVGTCLKCHVNIEQVHVNVVDVSMWAKNPMKVPACVECHPPHNRRMVVYKDSLSDGSCMECHSKPDMVKTMPDGTEKSLFVDLTEFEGTLHGEKHISCAKCHDNVLHGCKNTQNPVSCGNCHDELMKMFNTSTHGKLVAANDPNGPLCHDCHGGHRILPTSNPESPTFTRNIAALCAKCHREGQKAAMRYEGEQHEIVKHYEMSTHGKGVQEAGLVVSATCTNCHTAHHVLPASDPESSVNHNNVPKTCAQCHEGIVEIFATSIHSVKVSGPNDKLPSCVECHTSHEINRVDQASFRSGILDQCGNCHEHESESYFESYHGRASLLAGGESTAKCSDCHGSHNILPVDREGSTLHGQNAVETCRQCHAKSNPNFTMYITHASHNDKERFPALYYSFWGMTLLLIGTFAFFGLHTLFWFPRSFRNRFVQRRKHSHESIIK